VTPEHYREIGGSFRMFQHHVDVREEHLAW